MKLQDKRSGRRLSYQRPEIRALRMIDATLAKPAAQPSGEGSTTGTKSVSATPTGQNGSQGTASDRPTG